MTRRVLLLGAGSHGRLLCEQLESDPDLRVAGFTDPDPDLEGGEVRRHDVLGEDSDVPALWAQDAFDVALVGVGDSDLNVRAELGAALREQGVPLLTFVHDAAEVLDSAQVGDGTVVMPQSYVGTEATLGDNAVVYSSVTIEHESVIADHAYVAPGAVLCGNASVGRTALIGASATVLPDCSIGNDAVVGAGSVVTSDVEAGERVSGVPAETLE